jgi:hypothetical protein
LTVLGIELGFNCIAEMDTKTASTASAPPPREASSVVFGSKVPGATWLVVSRLAFVCSVSSGKGVALNGLAGEGAFVMTIVAGSMDFSCSVGLGGVPTAQEVKAREQFSPASKLHSESGPGA